MFGHYLSNKNEGATVAPKSKFRELNKALVYWSIATWDIQVPETVLQQAREKYENA